MFEISVGREFSASHQLRLLDGSLEPLHGHNWKVKVTVGAGKLDEMGVIMDFHELERMMDGIVDPMHNRHLNEVEAFRTVNPSAENVALHIADALRLPVEVRLISVEVWETEGCSAVYRP
jgi:6-pyruvoyltetrahydropterin/6-carboxytetrahydropterin synthase